METNKKENEKLFYKVLKNLRKVKQVEIKHGTNKTQKGRAIDRNRYAVRRRWNTHLKELLNTKAKRVTNNRKKKLKKGKWKVAKRKMMT